MTNVQVLNGLMTHFAQKRVIWQDTNYHSGAINSKTRTRRASELFRYIYDGSCSLSEPHDGTLSIQPSPLPKNSSKRPWKSTDPRHITAANRLFAKIICNLYFHNDEDVNYHSKSEFLKRFLDYFSPFSKNKIKIFRQCLQSDGENKLLRYENIIFSG